MSDEAKKKRLAFIKGMDGKKESGTEDTVEDRQAVLGEAFVRGKDKIVGWHKRRVSAAADFILTRAKNRFLCGFPEEVVAVMRTIVPAKGGDEQELNDEQSEAIMAMIPDCLQYIWCLSATEDELIEAFESDGYFKREVARLAVQIPDMDWGEAVANIAAINHERQMAEAKPKPPKKKGKKGGKKKR